MNLSNPRSLLRALLIFGLGCLAARQCAALPIGLATDNGDGTFTYSYTLDNTAGTFDIIGWSLEFQFDSALIDWNQLDVAGGGDVSVPNANWIAQAGIPFFGLSSQDFFSLDPLSDVAIGSSLIGFSFVSAHAPDLIDYYVEFGAGGESSSGTIIGPGMEMAPANGVPEGGSGMVYGLIAVGFCWGAGRWLKPLKGSNFV